MFFPEDLENTPFKDMSILAYLAWPKKTSMRTMSLKFNQMQMSILNS